MTEQEQADAIEAILGSAVKCMHCGRYTFPWTSERLTTSYVREFWNQYCSDCAEFHFRLSHLTVCFLKTGEAQTLLEE